MATNFIVGRCTASAIASASLKSFFWPFAYDVLCRHQPGVVAQRFQATAEVVGADACLHADQAGGRLASRAST